MSTEQPQEEQHEGDLEEQEQEKAVPPVQIPQYYVLENTVCPACRGARTVRGQTRVIGGITKPGPRENCRTCNVTGRVDIKVPLLEALIRLGLIEASVPPEKVEEYQQQQEEQAKQREKDKEN